VAFPDGQGTDHGDPAIPPGRAGRDSKEALEKPECIGSVPIDWSRYVAFPQGGGSILMELPDACREETREPQVPVGEKVAWDIGDVAQMTGLGQRTIWRLVGEGKFPSPRKPEGCKRKLWLPDEVREWIAHAPPAPT
jgi:predicted DNA-binding transcriptional regulator AlpA